MKRLGITTILVLTSVMMLFANGNAEGADSDSYAAIQERGYFVLGLDDSFPPMGFRNEAGEIDGFDIDLARELASRLGLELKLRPVDWDGVLLSLNKGDIDLIWNGLSISEKRKERIDFSKPYLANRQVIVVQPGSGINGKADLAGAVVGIQLGSTSEEALRKSPEVLDSFKQLKKYSNNVEALMDLGAGRLDAVVLDEIVGRYYIAKHPEEYMVLEDDFGREEYGIGFRKGDDSFRAAVDEAFDQMRRDGSAAEISKTWFGEEIILD